MSKMSTLEQLDFKYAMLSTREKVMVLVLAIGVTLFLLFELLLAPTLSQAEKLEANKTSITAKIANIDAETNLANARLSEDPNQPLAERIARLEKRIADMDNQFVHEINELIAPQDMPKVLQTIFSKSTGLEIIAMQSQPAVNLFANDPQNLSSSLYQHGLSLSFRGEFFAVMQFLQALESMEYQMYWHALDYDVEEYPQARVELEVFTLSSHPDFIGV
jgi:MSHA biogenesis protein MshJ